MHPNSRRTSSDTAVHGFDTPDGALAADGVVVGTALGPEIGVSEGDAVELSFPTLGTSFTTTITGFVDEPLGTLVYMDQAAFERAIGAAEPSIPPEVLAEPSISLVKVVVDDGADRAGVITSIEELETVAVVVDSRGLYDMFQDFLGFFYAFVGIMLVFGAVMAFALIFNTISVNVAEREGEYATMRANGLSQRKLASLITGENLLLTALGIIPGLIVGYAVAALFMQSYSSDMFAFKLDMNTSTLVFSSLAMLGRGPALGASGHPHRSSPRHREGGSRAVCLAERGLNSWERSGPQHLAPFTLVRAAPYTESLAGLDGKLEALVGNGTCVAHGKCGAFVGTGGGKEDLGVRFPACRVDRPRAFLEHRGLKRRDFHCRVHVQAFLVWYPAMTLGMHAEVPVSRHFAHGPIYTRFRHRGGAPALLRLHRAYRAR